MNLYEVGVSSSKYHGSQALTYASSEVIATGSLVSVPLRFGQSLGIVLGRAQADPKITAKPISAVYDDVRLPKTQLDLLAWMRTYYPAPLSTIVQLFVPTAVALQPTSTDTSRQQSTLPALTDEQQQAISKLTETTSTTALLHGDTGVGKTRVYLELANHVLAQGQSVIVLVPEIGLVPQMLAFFKAHSSAVVHSIHSGMTPKVRRETWRAIQSCSTPQVVIGPRSALFMPVSQLGLVVVDEAHDNGYKQDQLPYYEATRVAAKLAALSNGLCLYGTATPRVADYWHLVQHKTPVIRMAQQVKNSIKAPQCTIIDAAERKHFDRSTVFSETMLEAMRAALSRGEQTLVFLNRRGTARFVSCSACGWHAACELCDTPLTYHGDKHLLQCHTCGTTQPVPTVCPVCQSAELRYQRRGTKALQSELEKLFPEARIGRFDSDNAKADALASQYKAISDGSVDIIIGTQVIAKGLDLGKLTLVCIPQADTSTYLPDFSADEQTFQLLKQVIGRVGRTDKASQVILQTYMPNSPIIQAAVTNNWQDFYDQQIKHRQKYNFPPFMYLLQLTTVKASVSSAKNSAEKLRDVVVKTHPNCEVLGPAPRFHEKIQGKYQWQLVLKSSKRQELLEIIAELPSGWRYNIDPGNLL